jgi:hypothetical protein
MYNFDIQAKVSMLPENAKREIFDFIKFILSKYGQARKRKFRFPKMSRRSGLSPLNLC